VLALRRLPTLREIGSFGAWLALSLAIWRMTTPAVGARGSTGDDRLRMIGARKDRRR